VLTYTQVLYRSLRISAILLIVDWIAVYLSRNYVYPYELFGDLLLIETAALFLVAGILDFGTSVGFAGFKSFFTHSRRSSEESFSASTRKDTERRAMVLVVSGFTLFVILVLLANFSAVR